MNMPTSEVLDLAADEIQRRGWTQGSDGWKVEGPACLEGGIAAVSGVGTIDMGEDGVHYRDWEITSCPAFQAVQAYLDGRRPYSFNDDWDRTEEDVIAVLRAAAAIERAKEAAYAPVEVAA